MLPDIQCHNISFVLCQFTHIVFRKGMLRIRMEMLRTQQMLGFGLHLLLAVLKCLQTKINENQIFITYMFGTVWPASILVEFSSTGVTNRARR